MRARSAPERSNVFRQAAQAAEPFPIEVLEAHWFLIEQAQRGRFELRRHETVAKLLDDREVA